MSDLVAFPGSGCVVEYLQGNEVQIAWVLEEQKGRMRLLSPMRKEIAMASGRVLPWAGPSYPPAKSREEIVEILQRRKERREQLMKEISPVDLWEMAQGEMRTASAEWFAELVWDAPDADAVSACGRALVACKSHFKFQPPVFEIYNAETVEARRLAEEAAREHASLVAEGNGWLHALWNAAQGKGASLPDAPAGAIAGRLIRMLKARMKDPGTTEDETLWKQIARGLPDDPNLPLLLLQAWGILPPHYDFWLERADYDAGTEWEAEHAGEVASIIARSEKDAPPPSGISFVSIDSATTRDIDDAFHIGQASDGGWDVSLAFACPALHWDFGGGLDKAVADRSTSLYLPEGTSHMMPEALGAGALSLFAGTPRPAMLAHVRVAPDGSIAESRFETATVRLAANLDYASCETALAGGESSASPFADQLRMASAMGQARLDYRLRKGAIIIERPELNFELEGEGEGVTVRIRQDEETPQAGLLVSELMILANEALAQWAVAHGVPMLYRVQDISVPPEFSGIWRSAQDIARVVRVLTAASLDVMPRPHAAIGLPAYCTFTSPLRRYADLVNEAQLLHFLSEGSPRWNVQELGLLRPQLSLRLEAVGHVQRYRQRYWKYLYMEQQSRLAGEEYRWKAEVTENTDMGVGIYLPETQVSLRARRQLFGEEANAGENFYVRLGRINPLRFEASVIGACRA